jgi:hypothetical protein
MSDPNHGVVREAQVRELAARLGVADFVYSAPQVAKGSSQREASGDGLILIGSNGAVLQVKTRDPQKAEGDSDKRAEEWVRKNARKARDQGLGAKRELVRRYRAGVPITVYPVRATGLSPDVRSLYARRVVDDASSWPVIVVVDHPRCPALDLGFESGVAWFTFKDWHELQRRLRSTAALLHYLKRIFEGSHHVRLGCEVQRYGPMYRADEETVTGIDTARPYLAHPDHFDELGTNLFHDLIDNVWQHDGDIPWQSPEEYRAMVEFLDAVPPSGQSAVGRWPLQKRHEMAKGQQVASGLHQLHLRDRLVYACSELRHWKAIQSWRAEFTAYVSMRHAQALETGAPEESTTFGIGALVDERKRVSYSFVMLLGRNAVASVKLPRDLRRWLEWKYGIHDHDGRETREAAFSLNEPCPCASGKKFKRCHGRASVR